MIGYRVDADVGPTVMLAAGGVLAEILRDRSIRLAPVDLAEAKAMIGEVVGAEGAGRLSAASRRAISTRWRRRWCRCRGLRCMTGLRVAEAEINPLMVRPKGEGVVAVDALVRLA